MTQLHCHLLLLFALLLVSESKDFIRPKRLNHKMKDDALKKQILKQKEVKNANYYKQKRLQQARVKKCDNINHTLTFPNDKDQEIWLYYNCPALLNYRKQKNAEEGLEHSKCTSFYLGRRAAENWCSRVQVKRVFTSPRDERIWMSSDCDSVRFPMSEMSGSDRKARNAHILYRKKNAIKVMTEKVERDTWCVKSHSLIQEQTKYGLTPSIDNQTWAKYDCDYALKTYVRDYEVCNSLDDIKFNGSSHGVNSRNLPVIAIMAASTSRGLNETESFTHIPLFKTLFPSLLCNLDCGFKYIFVMGYDEGDNFYDSVESIDKVFAWFNSYIASPLQRNGIDISLHPVRVKNSAKRPGPVFTAIAKAAYGLHADYYYRVNDDSEFLGKWAKLYTNTLKQHPLQLGVIGPSCYHSRDRILTHDFVYKTHMEIFNGIYYPIEFSDWYMDDWISAVYGPQLTFISKKVGIDHHFRYRERSYDVNRENLKLLDPLVKSGQEKIIQFLEEKVANGAIPQEYVTSFKKDISKKLPKRNKEEGYFQKIY